MLEREIYNRIMNKQPINKQKLKHKNYPQM